MSKTAGIVIIGNEILAGKFPEENAVFLIGELRRLGVELRQIVVIPDEIADISQQVRNCSQRFDYVFTSGGVGPTHDDVTMAGIAAAFEGEVEIHPDLLARVIKRCGPKMPPANKRLAEVPTGTALVYPPGKDWPIRRCRNVYILPGVPRLFRDKFLSIREQFRDLPICEERIYCDASEGMIAPILSRVGTAYPRVRIGSYPRAGQQRYQVVLTLESTDKALLTEAVTLLRKELGPVVVSV